MSLCECNIQVVINEKVEEQGENRGKEIKDAEADTQGDDRIFLWANANKNTLLNSKSGLKVHQLKACVKRTIIIYEIS